MLHPGIIAIRQRHHRALDWQFHLEKQVIAWRGLFEKICEKGNQKSGIGRIPGIYAFNHQ
jgi:hypothetical protein